MVTTDSMEFLDAETNLLLLFENNIHEINIVIKITNK
jgi:hypothetical protein